MAGLALRLLLRFGVEASMLSSQRWLGLIVAIVTLGFGALAEAAPAAADDNARKLTIFSVAVNRTSETLTIRGVNFGRRAPSVGCEKWPMTVMSATDTELVVYFPAAIAD